VRDLTGVGGVKPAPPFQPPYWVAVFTSKLADNAEGYSVTADAMVALAKTQPGYLGHDSARGADGLGITVSYWRDEASILAWKRQGDHVAAQTAGHQQWYNAYTVHIAEVSRAYAKVAKTS
jgi:heme-degrading monooxygenase HmoA